jgi:hypothetical protein
MQKYLFWVASVATLSLMVLGSPRANADIIVHDPAVEWILPMEPVMHGWAGDKLLNVAGFVGNGQHLSTVGIYFGSSLGGVPNQGAIHSWGWSMFFYESQSALELNPQSPTEVVSFGSPTNAGWSEVLFQLETPAGNFDIMYAEVDVSSFGISTTSGQLQYATLVPTPQVFQGSAMLPLTIGNGIGEPNWYYFNFGFGPAPLSTLTGQDFATVKVTTIPTPGAACLGLAAAALGGRRQRCSKASAVAITRQLP